MGNSQCGYQLLSGWRATHAGAQRASCGSATPGDTRSGRLPTPTDDCFSFSPLPVPPMPVSARACSSLYFRRPCLFLNPIVSLVVEAAKGKPSRIEAAKMALVRCRDMSVSQSEDFAVPPCLSRCWYHQQRCRLVRTRCRGLAAYAIFYNRMPLESGLPAYQETYFTQRKK
eukprot:6194786-Pleurochrysis_carterae.AAC.1